MRPALSACRSGYVENPEGRSQRVPAHRDRESADPPGRAAGPSIPGAHADVARCRAEHCQEKSARRAFYTRGGRRPRRFSNRGAGKLRRTLLELWRAPFRAFRRRPRDPATALHLESRLAVAALVCGPLVRVQRQQWPKVCRLTTWAGHTGVPGGHASIHDSAVSRNPAPVWLMHP